MRREDPKTVIARRLPRKQSPSATVGDRLDVWIEHRAAAQKSGQLSANTLRDERRFAAGYAAPLRALLLTDLDYAVVQDWAAALLAQGKSAKTVANALGTLRIFVRWAVARKELPAFPVWPESPKPTQYRPKLIDLEAQARVLAAIREDRRGIFLALRTGIRPSEARALNAEDWDRDRGLLFVNHAMLGQRSDAVRGPRKNRKLRAPVLIDRELGEWLFAFRSSAQPGEPIFLNPDGQPVGRYLHNALAVTWRDACKKAGVWIGLYAGLKHSTATGAQAAGASPGQLQNAMGHAEKRSVDFYAQHTEVGNLFLLAVQDESTDSERDLSARNHWRSQRESNPRRTRLSS